MGIRIRARSLARLCLPLIPTEPTIPLSVDRKLALRPSLHLPVFAIFIFPPCSTRRAPPAFRINALDNAITPLVAGHVETLLGFRCRLAGDRGDFRQGQSGLDYDDHAHCQRYWDALCSKFALPILFMALLDHAVFALEKRAASHLRHWSLGGAGVGLECLSEYERELDGCGGCVGCAGVGNLVGWQERLVGVEREWNEEE